MFRPTRILYIVDQLCELGGAERVLLNMIRLLPRDRFAPQLVTFKIDPSLGIFDNFPCPFHLFPLRRTWDWNAARVAWQIRQLVRRERIDIVHTFFETSDIWGGPVCRLSGARVLVSSRRDMGILRSRKHRLAYRVVNRLYDQIQTVSDQVRGYYIEHDGLPPERVVTIYNGVSVDKAERASAAAVAIVPTLAHASHVVATIAHVRHVKGIDILLRTAVLVRKRYPNVRFVVVGDNHQPDHFKELLNLRSQLGLEDCVHFPGPVEDVFAVLRAAHAFLLPSRSEGLSNALLEAMACGLPCVATNVGGNPELIDEGDNGFLVPVEDPAATAARLIALLDNPDLARRMGARGRRMVEARFTTEAMMEQLESSYARLRNDWSHEHH